MSAPRKTSFCEQVQDLAIQALQGDPTSLFEAIKYFILRLALDWNAEQFNSRNDYTVEDWVAIAYAQLCEKLSMFDPERGSFLSWARQVIRRRWINESKKRNHDVAGTEEYLRFVSPPGDEPSVADIFDGEESDDPYVRLEVRHIVRQYLGEFITREEAKSMLSRLGYFIPLFVCGLVLRNLLS